MRILILGSGPLFPSQGGEFESSGTQTLRAIQDMGMEGVVLNNNSASIQLQPGFASSSHVLAVNPENLRSVVLNIQPKTVFIHSGGQTALNCALQSELPSELFAGTPLSQIRLCESREGFDSVVKKLGYASSAVQDRVYPLLARTRQSLGGQNAHFVHSEQELRKLYQQCPAETFDLNRSLKGLLEIEMEIVRDSLGNSLIVAVLENVHPVGIHTGDSEVFCPPVSLPASLYYPMRQAALKLSEAFELHGAANIQFAIDIQKNEFYPLEMNLRLSRSSCLASKVTGWPIAYITARLLAGETLLDFPNYLDEPGLNFFARKKPVFQFEKFQGATGELGPNMQSIGESVSLAATLGDLDKPTTQCFPRNVNRFSGVRPDPGSIYFLNRFEDPQYQPLKDSVLIVGPGPYRIGTSLEFDAFLMAVLRCLRQAGIPSQVLNENPASSICDPLFAERIWLVKPTHTVLERILELEQPKGLILCGAAQRGQELSLKSSLHPLGHPVASIEVCEDRSQFERLLESLGLNYVKPLQTPQFPCLYRPSGIIGGESMRVLTSEEPLQGNLYPYCPHYKELEADIVALEGCIEALVFHEQIEPAGIHSGDSRLISPPQNVADSILQKARQACQILTKALEASGPLNIQFLYREDRLMVLECNLRASRSLPFSALASQTPLLDLAAYSVLHSLGVDRPQFSAPQNPVPMLRSPHFAWDRIRGSRPGLGVTMCSTGESLAPYDFTDPQTD